MQSTAAKKIIVSVTSDLVADNRVHKVSHSLSAMGFQVLVIGRELPGSMEMVNRSYATRRLKLLFTKGPFFYACYNVRLLLLLLLSKFDILLANDLDTLPANFLASVLKRKPLIYDSHEYFTEVPELVTRPRVKRIWEWLEGLFVPHVDGAYTVCESIANIYTKKYKVPFRVVRNFPKPSEIGTQVVVTQSQPVILYQGAVNVGRGLRQTILAMHYMEGAKLVIAGDGDIRKELEELVEHEGLNDKVDFRGRLSIEDLALLTPTASVGISVEEDVGLNYRYALPNKLFDYIQAKVPVLVTNLPEMAAIVHHYNVGEVIAGLEPSKLGAVLTEMIRNQDKRQVWKANLDKASRELVWATEERVLQKIFAGYL